MENLRRSHLKPKSSLRFAGAGVTVILLIWLLTLQGWPSAHAATEAMVFDDTLASGWNNWSWDTTLDFANGEPVHTGAHSLSVHYDSAWAGLYLHADPALPTANYTHLSFWIHGGPTGHQSINIVPNGDGSHRVHITTTSNTWQKVDVALADLGGPATLQDLYWQDAGGGAQPVYYLDDIMLTDLGSGPPPSPTPTAIPTPPPTQSITVTIDAAADRRPINPYIYGMNFAGEELAKELELPVNRRGGNSMSRYNYLTDVSNHARDWYFENIKESDAENLPEDSDAIRFIEGNRRTQTESLLTLPLSGYVANGVDRACGFSVKKYGAQSATDPWQADCGNGMHSDGSLVSGNDPLDTSVIAGPSFAAGWVEYLVDRYGPAASGGIRIYNLDNEPDIWFDTHRDVQPIGWKYQEFRDRTIAFASAIKAADPAAELAGPVVMGWTYYWYGAYDGQREDWASPDDRMANGDVPFAPWYLRELKTYEDTHGVRLLDYFDLHYYPQAPGVSLLPAGNSSMQALRLRSTRSLWDPDYVDESWIRDAGPDGGIVRLIPRMKEWVAQYYPGTRLAMTEYNWGALEHINGALAQAEVLGIFGREGMDLATLWAPPQPNQPGAYAFRMFRNYDGKGAKFGDTSVRAVSGDVSKLGTYAAQKQDGSLTLILINKATQPITATIDLAGFTPAATGAMHRYSSARPDAIEHLGQITITGAKLNVPCPIESITLVVIPRAETVFRNWLYLPSAHR